MENSIDIIVTVYNALEDVKKCIQSLKENLCDDFAVHIIIVNDFSDDATSEWLRNLCKDDSLFTLRENSSNIGYTKSVNIGMKASNAQYVILLNSDTIVTKGWLTKMVHCMHLNPKIGIVGPLSNCAGFQNIPCLYNKNGDIALDGIPQEIIIDKMAEIVEKISLHLYPHLHFVNGFCYMIRREVIDTIGFMDEVNFPIGYGEEDDYSIRAYDAGFLLAVADDTFIFHGKSKNFCYERRIDLSHDGTQKIREKHSPQKCNILIMRDKQYNKELLDIVCAKIQRELNKEIFTYVPQEKNLHFLFLFPENTSIKETETLFHTIVAMIQSGIDITIATKFPQRRKFLSIYNNIFDIEKICYDYNNVSLADLAENCDVVIGVGCLSLRLIQHIATFFKRILPTYYCQPYEKNFFDEYSYEWYEEKKSHSLSDNILIFDDTKKEENSEKINSLLDMSHEKVKSLRSKQDSTSKSLLIMPCASIKIFPATHYIRVLFPYQFIAEHHTLQIRHVYTLPAPSSADAVLLERDLWYDYSVLAKWIARWKLRGGKIIYETDDDLMDLDAISERCGTVSKYCRENIQLLAYTADAIHVSTPRLYEIFSQYNSNVHLILNALDKDLWQLEYPRIHNVGKFKRDENVVRIGYIGTPTHTADLQIIQEAIHALEQKYKEKITIEIIGAFDKIPTLFGKKIELPQKNEYPDFVRWLYNTIHWDIGLIPLVDDSFNRSKSFLKFLEYSALDMAIAVSDVPTYQSIARHNQNCLVAKNTTEDWIEKLSALIENKTLRETLATQARKECLQYHTLESQAKYIEASLQKIGLLD